MALWVMWRESVESYEYGSGQTAVDLLWNEIVEEQIGKLDAKVQKRVKRLQRKEERKRQKWKFEKADEINAKWKNEVAKWLDARNRWTIWVSWSEINTWIELAQEKWIANIRLRSDAITLAIQNDTMDPQKWLVELIQLDKQLTQYDGKWYGLDEVRRKIYAWRKAAHDKLGWYIMSPDAKTFVPCGAARTYGGGYTGIVDAFEKKWLPWALDHSISRLSKSGPLGWAALAAWLFIAWKGLLKATFGDGDRKDAVQWIGIGAGIIGWWYFLLTTTGNDLKKMWDSWWLDTTKVHTDSIESWIFAPMYANAILWNIPLEHLNQFVTFDGSGNPIKFDYEWFKKRVKESGKFVEPQKSNILTTLKDAMGRMAMTGKDLFVDAFSFVWATAASFVDWTKQTFSDIFKQREVEFDASKKAVVDNRKAVTWQIDEKSVDKFADRYDDGMNDIVMRKQWNDIIVNRTGKWSNLDARVNPQSGTIFFKDKNWIEQSLQLPAWTPTEDMLWMAYNLSKLTDQLAGRSSVSDPFYVQGTDPAWWWTEGMRKPIEVAGNWIEWKTQTIFGDLWFKATKGEWFPDDVVDFGRLSGAPDTINDRWFVQDLASYLNGLWHWNVAGSSVMPNPNNNPNNNPDIYRNLTLPENRFASSNVLKTAVAAKNGKHFDAAMLNSFGSSSVKKALEKSQNETISQSQLDRAIAAVQQALNQIPASLRNALPLHQLVFVSQYDDEKFPWNELGFYHPQSKTMVLDLSDGPDKMKETILHEWTHHLDMNIPSARKQERARLNWSYEWAAFTQPNFLWVGYTEKYGAYSLEEDIATIGERMFDPVRRKELLQKAFAEQNDGKLKQKIELFIGYDLQESGWNYIFGSKRQDWWLVQQWWLSDEDAKKLTDIPLL